jgi:asparagine synthetase B (glutamine-hydrolysing)
MCGLIAGVGKLNSNRIVALGSMSEERGTDSVGLGYITGGEIRIAKVADRPCVALNLALRKEVTAAAVSGMFIGHTRQATQGAVTSANAHPFLDGDIAFAHNGVILNDDDFGKYEVDSQSLIHGIKDKDFSKYEGCIALVWIEGGKLHAYRGGNPLYRGRQGGGTYLASDDEYLRAIGCTHIKELAEGMIYTFHSATSITTKRVPKNKSFTYQKNWQDDAPLQKLDNGAYYKPGATGWKLDAPRIPLAEAKEDFKTWKDERDEVEAKRNRCEICGMPAEEQHCFDCLQWLKYEMNADLPSEIKV